jgi:rhodanese-related sulfurtransferase
MIHRPTMRGAAMTERSEEDLVAEARGRISEMAPADAIAHRDAGGAVFLDVRELNEWNLFRIPGATHIPIGTLAAEAAARVPRDQDVIVYCNKGNRSVLATDQLRAMGWARVHSLTGGVMAWMSAGGELED